ncbi:hypothetical protein M1888_26495, partial [Klebsiella pneumoniae]|nr:hypothetical protein [Klebsiella pneumoniae]
MDSVHHIWCPLFSQEFQDLPDGAETTLTVFPALTVYYLRFVKAIDALGTVAKLAMRQPFVLFKGLTFQKLCLPGAFRPGDHHN